jgi:hypothetical protein
MIIYFFFFEFLRILAEFVTLQNKNIFTMYMLHRIMGSGFTVNKFFSEFLIYGPTFFKNSTFRVFLSLKYFKKYWFPLLF